MKKIKPYLKAVVAFVTPGAVLIGSSVLEASDGGKAITQAEWVTALVACLATSGVVWRVPNAAPKLPGDWRGQKIAASPVEVHLDGRAIHAALEKHKRQGGLR